MMIFGKKSYMQWDSFDERDKESEYWLMVTEATKGVYASA
jgi:hypothetical protein